MIFCFFVLSNLLFLVCGFSVNIVMCGVLILKFCFNDWLNMVSFFWISFLVIEEVILWIGICFVIKVIWKFFFIRIISDFELFFRCCLIYFVCLGKVNFLDWIVCLLIGVVIMILIKFFLNFFIVFLSVFKVVLLVFGLGFENFIFILLFV